MIAPEREENMSNEAQNNKEEKKRRLRSVRIWICVLTVLLLIAAAGCAAAYSFEKKLKACAYDTKDDLKATLACLAEQDADGAERMTDRLDEDVAGLDRLLASPLGRLAARTPFAEREMKVVEKVSGLVKEASDTLIRPYIGFMRENPMRSGELDLSLAERYIGFIQERGPDLLAFADRMEELSAMPYGRLESRLSGTREDMELLCRVIPFSLRLTDELLKPGVDFMQSWPLSSLKSEDGGFRVEAINRYLDFANEYIPRVSASLEEPEGLDLGERGEGKLREYLEKIESLLSLYDGTQEYRDLLRAFVGSGEDRLYLFAAQNSSEIRASGGFPGAIGTVRIRDGVLRIEEFQTVTEMLYFYRTWDTGISSDEVKIFGSWFLAPRDADFCPDFERVGEIWASAYQVENGEYVDGVISATPVIIQRLLSIVGEIELSDGTVLDGTNAAKTLEYDMYYRYFSYGSSSREGNRISDALFAETAEKVTEKLMDDISAENAVKLIEFVKESAADRTLMLWMKDRDEQELVRRAGLACSLNSDPAKPEAGIYFSLTNPSRMGWFLNMNPSVELLESHEDGSRSYAVRLDMSNVMTEQELATAGSYISGSGVRGAVTGYLYLFAPAGGTIGEVDCSVRSVRFTAAEYHGLDLMYTHQISLSPGSALTIEYTVTTAPCEQEELALSMTPTLQDYR